MPKGSSIAAFAAGVILAAFAFAQTRETTAVKTGYVRVNGLNLYYEVHGAGQSLILLQGALDYDTAEIQAPTLLVFGDADAVRTVPARDN